MWDQARHRIYKSCVCNDLQIVIGGIRGNRRRSCAHRTLDGVSRRQGRGCHGFGYCWSRGFIRWCGTTTGQGERTQSHDCYTRAAGRILHGRDPFVNGSTWRGSSLAVHRFGGLLTLPWDRLAWAPSNVQARYRYDRDCHVVPCRSFLRSFFFTRRVQAICLSGDRRPTSAFRLSRSGPM